MTDKNSVIDAIDIPAFYTDMLPTLKRGTRDEATSLCPFHNDHHPSFSINLETGLWFCHAGCGGGDVFTFVMRHHQIGFPEALRVLERRVRVQQEDIDTNRRIIRRHQWTDAEGNVAWKLRWSSGMKYTWSQDPNGKLRGRGSCEPTLYQLADLRLSKAIVVAEGEHDSDVWNRLLDDAGLLGIGATCTPNGAADVKPEYLAELDDIQVAWVSGDNDAPGQRYMERVASLLEGKVPIVVRLPVPHGFKDWAEWAAAGADAEAFKDLLQASLDSFLLSRDRPSEETNIVATRAGVYLTSRFAPIDIGDLLAQPEVSMPWIWENYLTEGAFASLAGFAKTGKTTFVNHLLCRHCSRRTFLRLRHQTGHCPYPPCLRRTRTGNKAATTLAWRGPA